MLNTDLLDTYSRTVSDVLDQVRSGVVALQLPLTRQTRNGQREVGHSVGRKIAITIVPGSRQTKR